ncbi:retrovirus-related pol polyprotein from transposon TNT 1-94 [Tanacetum coccineum]
MKLLTKTFNVFKNKYKEKEAKNIDKEIGLEKKIKELDNIVCKMGQSAQTVHMLIKPQVFYDNNLKQALGFQNPFYLKKAQKIRLMLYDGSVIAKETNVISIADSEETLMLEEESRSKMLLKQSDPMVFENKLQTSHPNTNQSASSPIKIEAPRELPKTNSAIEIQKEIILIETIDSGSKSFLRYCEYCYEFFCDYEYLCECAFFCAMNDSVNYVEMCNKCLKLEAELIKQHNMVEKDEYNRISKSFSKLEQHCISLELAMQLNKEIFQKNNTSVNQTEPTFDHLFELNNLKAELQAKDTTIEKLKANIKRKSFCHNSIKNDLRKVKGKDIVNNATQVSNATTTAPGRYKLDPVTLVPKDKNNRETHIYYLKHTMKQAAILKEIVEQAKSLNPLDSASYSACKYVKLIQELLGYFRDTFPDIHTPSEKLVAVMPINKKKKVRFAEPVISSSTSQKQLGSSQTQAKQTTNNSMLTSTGVSWSTKSSSSMFDARHELCFLEFVSDMNASSKSKSVKKAKNKEEWKPTRKVFTKIRYNWRPTGRSFTLVRNACPLTKITGTNKVPLREPIPLEVVAQESVVTKVYIRRPKVVQIVLWYLDSGCSKHMTGDRSQLTNFVHKFLGTVKFGNDQIVKIIRISGNQPLYIVNWGYDGVFSNLSLVQSLKDQILVIAPTIACAMGKSKKQSYKPKSEDTNQEKLYLLHMNLCGPMRVASINGKKYILVIVDDYSRFAWVKFLASKDEAPDFTIKFQKMIQVRLNAPARNIRTDNGTEFFNQTLRSYYESIGISHETSVA